MKILASFTSILGVHIKPVISLSIRWRRGRKTLSLNNNKRPG
jgi:hypothetical protein